MLKNTFTCVQPLSNKILQRESERWRQQRSKVTTRESQVKITRDSGWLDRSARSRSHDLPSPRSSASTARPICVSVPVGCASIPVLFSAFGSAARHHAMWYTLTANQVPLGWSQRYSSLASGRVKGIVHGSAFDVFVRYNRSDGSLARCGGHVLARCKQQRPGRAPVHRLPLTKTAARGRHHDTSLHEFTPAGWLIFATPLPSAKVDGSFVDLQIQSLDSLHFFLDFLDSLFWFSFFFFVVLLHLILEHLISDDRGTNFQRLERLKICEHKLYLCLLFGRSKFYF